MDKDTLDISGNVAMSGIEYLFTPGDSKHQSQQSDFVCKDCNDDSIFVGDVVRFRKEPFAFPFSGEIVIINGKPHVKTYSILLKKHKYYTLV